jgi:hypothetical protein
MELEDRQGNGFLSSPCPDKLWGPHTFISIWYWGFFLGEKATTA